MKKFKIAYRQSAVITTIDTVIAESIEDLKRGEWARINKVRPTHKVTDTDDVDGWVDPESKWSIVEEGEYMNIDMDVHSWRNK